MAAVREGPWKILNSGKKVALAAGLSVGATVGYIIYRHIKNNSAQCQKTEQSTLSIPLEVYRSIARHQSSFLDLVNQRSGAQVNVQQDGTEHGSVSFLLQGTAHQLLLAKCALEKLAIDCEIVTEEMEVPQTAFGRIIGRGGETLKFITRTSGARVNCSRGHSLEEKGKVNIVGTRQEIQNAKEMIQEKVAESETVRKRISQSSAQRQKRRTSELEPVHRVQGAETNIMQSMNEEHLLSPQTEASFIQANGSTEFASSGDYTAENSLKSDEEDIVSPASPLEVSKFEIPSPDLSFQPGEHLEVFVSASESPQHFWIQIVGVRSLQLDKLTAEMSRFYNGDALHEHRVEAIVVGDIVAAPYRDYGTWNRARVLGILSSGLVDLYYVDFGDNGELPRDQLCSLRSDFLSLPFQAIECSLAGVRPAGDVWTEEALDDFEQITYCAEWKPLLAKLCSYSHSEMSCWPSVKLYDNNQGKIVDLGEELIRLGHANSCSDEGNGLRGDGDEPRSLQKMLDDMTGVTSELSMSCISLSVEPWESKQPDWSSSFSSLEIERADVDQNPSDRHALSSTSSLIRTTPSVSLSELVSNVIDTSSTAPTSLSPDEGTGAYQSPSAFTTNLLLGPQRQPIQKFSSPITSSSSSVNAVASALNSMNFSDDVFLETCSSSCNLTASSELEDTESSLCACSEASRSPNDSSSSGIRGVWYYLTSSADSSSTSVDTTMPMSSSSSSFPTSSSSRLTPETSPSVIVLSSDLSDSAEDAGMADGDGPNPVGLCKRRQDLYAGSVTSVADSSICSSAGSDVIYIGSDKPVSGASAKEKRNSQLADKNAEKQQISFEFNKEVGECHNGSLGENKKQGKGEQATSTETSTESENKMDSGGGLSVTGAAGYSDFTIHESTMGVTE